jgi:hypothetical protein
LIFKGFYPGHKKSRREWPVDLCSHVDNAHLENALANVCGYLWPTRGRDFQGSGPGNHRRPLDSSLPMKDLQCVKPRPRIRARNGSPVN